MTTDTLPYGFQQALPPGIDGYLGIAHLFCGNIVYAFFFENYGNGVASELILSKRIKRTSMVPMRIAISTQIWKEPSVGSDRWTRKYHSQSEYKRRIIDGEKHRSQWRDYQDEEEVASVFYPNHPVWYDNPILVSLPIPIVPAEDLFLNLQEFILSQNDKPIVDNRTDRQKLEAAGFDNKTSFRKM